MFLINSSIYIEVDGEVCLLAIVPYLCKVFWLYRLSDNNKLHSLFETGSVNLSTEWSLALSFCDALFGHYRWTQNFLSM